jgi:hypothetical protein
MNGKDLGVRRKTFCLGQGFTRFTGYKLKFDF